MKFRTPSVFNLAVCVGWVGLVTCFSTNASAILLEVPQRAPQYASRILHPAFTSLSVDPAFWVEFFGNLERPNKLSFQLIKHIADRTGVSPWIRPGGVTQDSSLFDAKFGEPVRDVSTAGGIYRTTYGAEYFKSFSNFAPSTKFTVTLNLGNDTLGIALNQTKAAYRYLKADQIWAFECKYYPQIAILWKLTERNGTKFIDLGRRCNWTDAIDAAIPLKQPRWWGGSDGTTDDPKTVAIQTNLITSRGVTGKKVREFSQHMYQYSSCRPASNARAIVPNIMNHTNITSFVDILRSQISAANSVGSDFVVGEHLCRSGKVNITDTFGQALWALDTSLYSASLNVSRVYLHQGATLVFQSDNQENIPGTNGTPGFSSYNLWYPRDSELRGRARANPSYVSQLMLSEIVGKSRASQIVHLPPPANVSTDRFAAYGIYERKKLTKLALINFSVFNKTSTSGDAPGIRVHIEGNGSRTSRLKRMTAPGLDEKNADLVTWAGQAYTNGSAVGKLKLEPVINNTVWVRDSEAVLIDL
ncbi:glycoside hydrolase family 79 protein [Rhizoctonia solani AG-3 Rhs1AP]|uniref:Glycoside hydrolase family 79 protein n=2 Tax=Rhizoctonia solani AG-3 TaxID=1086053 RepID=A0A074SWB2_9AGAM|nr:glycoside hydrolase family 79 protein [Rhizoctonia solani AG-3 Rhs1AP]KEP54172.1 glycoside hydrolase family 79 protein [Rhizoctonia solani 123E]